MTEAPEMVKYTGRSGLTILLLADGICEDTLQLAYLYGCFGDIKPDLIWAHPETFTELVTLPGFRSGPDGNCTLYDIAVDKTEKVLPGIILLFLPVESATRLLARTTSLSLRKPEQDVVKEARPTQPIVELVISKELLNAHITCHRS